MASAKSYGSVAINNTDEDEIYRTERNGMVGYKVRVPNGTYNLDLLFAENYFHRDSSRIFDIYVEGQKIFPDVDIFKSAGSNTAYNLSVSKIKVEDEVLDIYFAAQVDLAILNGLTIENISTDVNNNGSGSIKSFNLYQNYPNPFNNRTIISFYLNEMQDVDFKIYDLLGALIINEHLGVLPAGKNQITWTASDQNGQQLSSGIYYYQIQGNEELKTRKLVLLK